MLRKLFKKYGKSSTEESLPRELHTSSQLTLQPVPLSTQARCGLQSAGNDVVCTGWLKKSPPEKKLVLYDWKKRWFILRRGHMSGEPGVLEYYKNEHSKKPLRSINLNFCKQLDVDLTFNKKEFKKRFIFDIITNERTFYLVAETEADMNRWVQSICHICGFRQTKGSTDALRNLSSVNHSLPSSPAKFSSSSQPLLQERKSSALSNSSQLPVSSHIQPALSTSEPQANQLLTQCKSRRTENARNARSSHCIQQESDTAAQKLTQGNRHCINRVEGQIHGFCSLPKSSHYSAFDLPCSLASHSHSKDILTVSAADSEDVYTFKTPRNTLCREFGELLVDTAIAPPPQHPKNPRWGIIQQIPPVSDYKYPTRSGETACWSTKSPEKTIMGQSDTASSDQIDVSVNPGSDNPMSTMPHHFASQGSKIQPPPVYRHLKPGQKAYPAPLDLRNNTFINELPFKSPVTKCWSTVNHTFNSSFSQYCLSISNTDSRDREDNCVPMQNPMTSSPVLNGTNNPAPKKSTGNLNYITLDFQTFTPCPHHKPFTTSVTSDEKVEYVQIDKEKTQALQKTIQEWTEMRQYSRPSRDAKLW